MYPGVAFNNKVVSNEDESKSTSYMIKMNVFKITAIALSLFLSACGTMGIGSEQNYRNDLKLYIGKPVDVLVNNIGHADSLSAAPNGNKLFVFNNSSSYTAPVNCKTNSNGYQSCTGGVTSESWCKTFFEVNSKNIVVAFTYKGDACSSCESKDVWLCF